jgi:hypothetical protein
MTAATADEIKLLFLEFQSAGVVFHHALKKQPWGAQNFVAKDPDGNLLLFAGPALTAWTVNFALAGAVECSSISYHDVATARIGRVECRWKERPTAVPRVRPIRLDQPC